MKIVQINAVYGIGSTGRMVRDIHEQLQRKGIESYVFWAIEQVGANNDSHIFRIGNDFDHKVHALMRRLDGRQGFHSNIATKLLCRKLKQIGPDVVHLHNLHSNYVNFEMLLDFLGKNRIPVLLTLHDCWFFTGGCMHYLRESCSKWKFDCSECSMRGIRTGDVEKLFQVKQKGYASIRDLYVNGVSKWTADAARESALLKNAKSITTIYNWIDTDTFSPMDTNTKIHAKYNIPKDKKIVLGVSQEWSHEKGLNEFVKISELFGERCTVMLVGDSIAIPKDKGIVAVGFTANQRELAELYSAADVFVNPSRMETFGLVTAEALACGTPVVAYDNTGARELVLSEGGVLVEDGNIEMLLETVNYMLGEKIEKRAVCSNYVKNNFAKNVQVKKYIELYNRIVSKECSNEWHE